MASTVPDGAAPTADDVASLAQAPHGLWTQAAFTVQSSSGFAAESPPGGVSTAFPPPGIVAVIPAESKSGTLRILGLAAVGELGRAHRVQTAICSPVADRAVAVIRCHPAVENP